MHRHSYKGRKFGRETDQRRALIKGLADSLVLNESIETTLPKAKEVVRYTEKVITKAKKGDLHNRRQVIAKLHTLEASHKLVDELAPKMSSRNSGHLRIVKTRARVGDGAVMARVSFVDEFSDKAELKKNVERRTENEEKSVETKPASKTEVKKPLAQKTVSSHANAGSAPAKRSGKRGNR